MSFDFQIKTSLVYCLTLLSCHVSYLKPRCNSFLKQRIFWSACMKLINVFIQRLSPRPHKSVLVWKRRFFPLVLLTVHPFLVKPPQKTHLLSGELWKRWLLVYVWTGENRLRGFRIQWCHSSHYACSVRDTIVFASFIVLAFFVDRRKWFKYAK